MGVGTDKPLIYTYDFGDNWEHLITVTGRSPPTDDFSCLSGTGHYVAEDAGAFRGWEELKAAYQTNNPTREQKEKRRWFERQASNADPKGLAGDRVNFFDLAECNKNLKNMWDRFEAMGEKSAEFQARMDAVMGGKK